jgi:hypothetical protein
VRDFAKKDDPNPRKADIDAAWPAIENALQLYNGAAARDIMLDLRKSDRAVWNGCRSRIRRHLVHWFRAHGLGTWDKFPQDDFSQEAFTSWIISIYDGSKVDPDNFASDDLPYIMQRLGEYAHDLDRQRAARNNPPAVGSRMIARAAEPIGIWK